MQTKAESGHQVQCPLFMNIVNTLFYIVYTGVFHTVFRKAENVKMLPNKKTESQGLF